MTVHHKEIKEFRTGLHRLISEMQDRKMQEFASQVEEKISSVAAPVEKKDMDRLLLMMRTLGQKLVDLEKAGQLGNGVPPEELEEMRGEITKLRGKVDTLDINDRRLMEQVRASSLPLRHLEQLDKKLKAPLVQEEKQIKKSRLLITELQERMSDVEKDLSQRTEDLKSSLDMTSASISKRFDEEKKEMEQWLKKKESELTTAASNEDIAITEKLNAKFLHWLGGLEETIKEKIAANLDSFDRLQKEIASLKKESATKKDISVLEEEVIPPIGELEKKMRSLLRSEMVKVQKELREQKAIEKIDRSVLQKEIMRIVSELEKSRISTLEGELESIMKESERLKKKKP